MNRLVPRIAIAAAAVLATATLGGWAATPHLTAPHAATAHVKVDKKRDTTVTIYLTRHGQTILNTLERVQGWTDSPLVDAAARALPVTVGKNIAAREGRFDAAYSADMKRHYETAQGILKGAHESWLPITQDPGLREINFGKYEGATNQEMWTDIVEHMGYTVDTTAAPTAPADATGQNGGWQTMQGIAATQKGIDAMMAAMKEIASTPAENGAVLPAENCQDVNARMAASLNQIAKTATKKHDDRVLVVSSGLSITCFLVDSLHATVAGGISNVAVSKLQYQDGTWTVLTVNDKSYQK
jgi:broad specificity phosphatase PhoE